MKRLGFFEQYFTEYQMINNIDLGGLSPKLAYESPPTLPREPQPSDSVLFPIIGESPNPKSFKQAFEQRILSWDSYLSNPIGI